jgi:multimeric flavodoxin WrbA
VTISILNGNPDFQNSNLDITIASLEPGLKYAGHTIKIFNLRDMKIKYCDGCFNCWIKSPGECKFNDDTHSIRQSFLFSDFVIFASPIIMGLTSALLKKAIDKLIPLLNPDFEFVNSEVHHKARYAKYPKIGLLLEKVYDTDDESIAIISDIYSRIALNLKTTIGFTLTTSESIERIIHEINSN